MKRQSVKKTSAVVTALATALTASCAFSALGASAAGNTAFPYTLFAGSDSAGALTVNAKHFNLNGSVASNGTIVTGKKVNLNGKKTEYGRETAKVKHCRHSRSTSKCGEGRKEPSANYREYPCNAVYGRFTVPCLVGKTCAHSHHECHVGRGKGKFQGRAQCNEGACKH